MANDVPNMLLRILEEKYPPLVLVAPERKDEKREVRRQHDDISYEPIVDQKSITVDIKDLECSICFSIKPNMMCNAYCMHPICDSCCNKINDKTKCPTCKKGAMWIQHSFINRMTNDLSVKCQWSDCSEKMSLKVYEVHARRCIHRDIKCKNSGCAWKGSWALSLDHINSCVFKPERCVNCDGKFTRGSIKMHVCPNRSAKCAKCDFTGPAWIVQDHEKTHDV